MKRAFTLLLLAATLLVFSGCVFDSDDEDDADVKKGSVRGTVKAMFTNDPVENVKVYLINRAAEIDSVSLDGNRAAFVDSAMTGADGTYEIADIAPGAYCVAPVYIDSLTAYRFTPGANSDPYEFSMNGETRTVNFIAETMSSQGAEADRFHIDVIFPKSDQHTLLTVSRERKYYSFFVSYWDNYYLVNFIFDKGDKDSISIFECYGYTAVLWTITNEFRYTVVYTSPGSSERKTATFEFGFGLTGVPEYSKWEYNIPTQTLTRRE